MTLNKFTSNSIGALQITHDKLHTDMDLSTKTLTVPTVVRGPASLTLDPATVGDNTGSVVIAGDLIVNGTTTTVNSNTVNIGDNLLVLNSDETGTPSQNSGIEIERGTSNNATLIWNETDDTFEVKVGTALADFRVETFTVTNINTTGSGSTNISAGANIELDATNRVLVTDTPFRLASMTTTQRNAIASPANGDMIYNSTTNQIESYENSAWTDTARSSSGFSSVVDDTTPQLGGDLDLNGNNITGTGNIELIDTTASVVYGPTIELYRNRTSPADGDTLGQLIFQGKDSSGNKSRFANIRAKAVSVTANSEDGQLDFVVTRNNNNDEVRLSIPSFAPTSFYRENVKLMAGVDLVFAGATDNANETTLTVTDPTGANTITFQNASGTVAFLTDVTGGSTPGNFTTISLDNNIVFEGSTADAYETTLAVADPTADRTITLPDNTGTIAVQTSDGMLQVEDTASNPNNLGININAVNSNSRSNFRIGPYSFDHWIIDVDPDQAENYSSMYFRVDNDFHMHLGNGNLGTPMNTMYKPVFFASGVGNSLMYAEGSTNDGNELEIRCTDPTADRIITFPDLSGTLLVNENLGGDPANDNGNLIISHGATGQPMANIQSGATSNIAIGNQNLTALTAGDRNFAIGKLCLDSETTGSGNIAIGEQTLGVGSGHSYNVAIGSLNTGTHGSSTGMSHNTFIGTGSGQYTASGDYNTQLGAYARSYYNNSSYGVAIGYACKHNHNYGTTVGSRAGDSMYVQSDYMTLIGAYAGYDMDGGDRCTFVGYAAGYSGGSGSYNASLGMDSLRDLTNGQYNAACGTGAGRNVESGSQNSFLGHNSGYDLTTGSYNTFLGYNSSNTQTNDLVSGSNNTFIGANSQGTSSSMSNTIILGDSNITGLQCNVQSISALSDERDKTDIQDLTLGLDFIKAMRPVQFTWNRRDGTLGTRKEVGFVAQELQEVEMDFNTKNRTHMVNDDDPNKLLASPMQSYPILIKAIQELSAKVDSLQAEVNTLKNGG